MKSCNSRIVVRQPFRLFQALRINQSYILATNILLTVCLVTSMQFTVFQVAKDDFAKNRYINV